MTKATVYATTLCIVGGAALVLDTAIIAIIDRSFDPLDSVLFLGGLVCSLTGLVTTAAVLTRRTAHPVINASGLLVGALLLMGLVASAANTIAHRTYHGSNIGLRGEWFFFLIGLMMLVIGIFTRRPEDVPAHSDAANDLMSTP